MQASIQTNSVRKVNHTLALLLLLLLLVAAVVYLVACIHAFYAKNFPAEEAARTVKLEVKQTKWYTTIIPTYPHYFDLRGKEKMLTF